MQRRSQAGRALLLGAMLCLWAGLGAVPSHARPSFKAWRAALWPDARAFGITRETFDSAFRGITPDTSLPDLVTPTE